MPLTTWPPVADHDGWARYPIVPEPRRVECCGWYHWLESGRYRCPYCGRELAGGY